MTKVTITLFFASLFTLHAVAQECPSKTFNNFAYDFMEHTDIQKRFTKNPLLSSYLVDGADEVIKKTELISARHLKFRRCSIYVLVNVFTPPNSHDFASLCFCSHTRNHAK